MVTFAVVSWSSWPFWPAELTSTIYLLHRYQSMNFLYWSSLKENKIPSQKITSIMQHLICTPSVCIFDHEHTHTQKPNPRQSHVSKALSTKVLFCLEGIIGNVVLVHCKSHQLKLLQKDAAWPTAHTSSSCSHTSPLSGSRRSQLTASLRIISILHTVLWFDLDYASEWQIGNDWKLKAFWTRLDEFAPAAGLYDNIIYTKEYTQKLSICWRTRSSRYKKKTYQPIDYPNY